MELTFWLAETLFSLLEQLKRKSKKKKSKTFANKPILLPQRVKTFAPHHEEQSELNSSDLVICLLLST